MSDKSPEERDGLMGLLKKLWLPVAGFLGAVTLAYNFYKLWLGDQATVVYFLAGSGLLILLTSLIWVTLGKKTTYQPSSFPLGATYIDVSPRFDRPFRRIAWVALGVILIGAIVGTTLIFQHRQSRQQKLIVVISAFEGPEEVYGLRNEIIEKLNENFASNKNIEIMPIDEVITLTKGSEHARQIGKENLADVVIWGWYRPTENPNINIHIENLSSEQFQPLKDSETMEPSITLADLESFSFQQQAGLETSGLISFLAGIIDFNVKDYKSAIESFDNAVTNLSTRPRLFQKQVEVYLYRGGANLAIGDYQRANQDFDQAVQINPENENTYNNRGMSYSLLGNYQSAIRDFDKAIQIKPDFFEAYSNRGVVYGILDDAQHAIQDYDKAIQIKPQSEAVYTNRGIAYGILQNYRRAIQDFDRAIQINPEFANAYYNRGYAYHNLGDIQRALQDYDKAIQINSEYTDAYYNRGNIYFYLDDYQQAVQNFDKVLQINPQDAEAYNYRGFVYFNLGDYQQAIQDFDQAIQINPKFADAYYNRGLVYQNMGSAVEADADFSKYKELTGNNKP